MTNDSTAGDGSGGRKPEFGDLFLFHSDQTQPSLSSRSCSSLVANASFNFNKKLDESSPCPEVDSSPSHLLPWTTTQSSSFTKLPWTADAASSPPPSPRGEDSNFAGNRLVGSLVRAELGHIYSLAASGDLLYTGSDSRNIRVWKKKKDFSGFKSSSGLVKAIVISGEKIFSGHQDGKIRVWKASSGKPSLHKQIGSLPTLKEFVKKSFNPKNYTQNRRHQNVLKIKHYDAVSCLSLNENEGLLYSGSWDKTIKVWRISDSKCLESIKAHDDSVNAVAVSGNGLVFTGSADGTVKAWRRELVIASAGGGDRKPLTKHVLAQILLRQENAITALAVNEGSDVVYCGASDGLMNYYWEREKRLSHGGVVRGHKMAVLCVAAAGRLVFSGSADKSICVWKREEESGVHSCLSVLTGHTGPVKCLAVEEDRQSSRKGEARWVVYSGSLDKSVKIWSVSERSPDLRRIHAGA